MAVLSRVALNELNNRMLGLGAPMDEKLVDTIVNKSQTINQVVDGGLGEEMDLRRLIEDTIR